VFNKFKQIALIDVSSLQTSCLDHLSKLSDGSLIFHAGLPRDLSETEKIIGAVDCLIVSLLVPLPKDVFKKCPSLRYVCVYGTSTRRIDLNAAKASGVLVDSIRHYCDRETAEFVLAQIASLARGLGNYQWKAEPTSLNGKRIGVVGMGSVGRALSELCLGIGMEVVYFSPNRKRDIEQKGAKYLPSIRFRSGRKRGEGRRFHSNHSHLSHFSGSRHFGEPSLMSAVKKRVT
jgi:phosphoglycerate dehydrogenase-like enzyme